MRPTHFSMPLACLIAVGILGTVAMVPSARACSCDYPDLGFLAEAEIEVPSNAKGLMWAGVIYSAGLLVSLPPVETFRIESWSEAGWTTIAHTVSLIRDATGRSRSPYDVLLVMPADGLVGGQRLRFTCHAREGRALVSAHRDSARDSQVVNVSVSHESFQSAHQYRSVSPDRSGKLNLAAGASCTRTVDAIWADIDDVLSPEIWKWKDSLFYSVAVGSGMWGGEYWHPRSHLCEALPPGRSWAGFGRERYYQVLGASGNTIENGFDLESGTALTSAWLPGTNSVLHTTVRFIPAGE